MLLLPYLNVKLWKTLFIHFFIHLFIYLCIYVLMYPQRCTEEQTVSSPVSLHCSAVHILLAVSCSLSVMFLWFHRSLSLLLSAGRVVLGRPSGLMIQSRFVFYFAAGCVLFARCYMLHEISLLAERERERAHHSIRNILRLSGQQAQTQQVVARVSVSSLLLISH